MLHLKRARGKKKNVHHGVKTVASPWSYQEGMPPIGVEEDLRKHVVSPGETEALDIIPKRTESTQQTYASCLWEWFSHLREEDKRECRLVHCSGSHRMSKRINRVHKPTNHCRQK